MEQKSLYHKDEQLTSNFTLNRFTLHHSAKSSIVSLDVNVNTQLISTNGKGKTATMNAIQIGFLPWNNFVDSKRKFYFIDSKGNPYSDNKSYNFYFPSENSCMFFEFTNPHGTFTQIVYRGNEQLSIHRAFIPLTIEQLYGWLWSFDDADGVDELGKPTRISLTGLKDKLKSVAGVQYARTPAEAKKIMYNGNLTQSEGVYSIARVNERNVDNLVDIFRLTAKASDISDEKIKSICISLITNTYIDNDRDKLNFKPHELLMQFEKLDSDSEVLTVRENQKSVFDSIKKSYVDLAQISKEMNTESILLNQSITEVRRKNSLDLGRIQNKIDDANKKSVLQNANKDKYKSEHDEAMGGMKVLEKDVNDMAKDMLHYEWLRKGTVPGARLGADPRFKERSDTAIFETDDEVIDATKEELKELREKLVQYNDRKILWSSISKLEEEIQGYDREIQSCEARIERFESRTGIYNTESVISPNKLVALNTSFSTIDTSVVEQHSRVLNEFASIFEEKEGFLYLIGDKDKISFGRVKAPEDIQVTINKLDELRIVRAKAEKKRAESMLIYESDEHVNQIPLENQIAMLKADVVVIEKIGHIYDDQKLKQQQCSELKETSIRLKNSIKDVESLITKTKSEIQSFEGELLNFSNIQNGLDQIQIEFKRILDGSGYSHDLTQVESLGKDKLLNDVTSANVQVIRDIVIKIDGLKEKIISGLSHMISHGVILDNENNLARSAKNFADIRKLLYAPLERLYDDLPQEKQLVSDQIRKHTDTTIEISNVLKMQIRHYSGVIKQLNDTLSKFTISNIDDMRLHMEMSQKVESFIKTIDSMGLEGTVTDISVARTVFYHVRQFVENMNISDKKVFSVTADQIIDKIILEFKHEDKWTDTTGSNGQTLVSTAVLLSLFIEHICGKGVHLSIPINVDEVSNIDYNNLTQLAEFMASKKLVLFSASPEIGIGHENIFENYVSIDDSQVHDKDIVLSASHYTVFHHFFGSMYQKERFDSFSELTENNFFGELEGDDLKAVVSHS